MRPIEWMTSGPLPFFIGMAVILGPKALVVWIVSHFAGGRPGSPRDPGDAAARPAKEPRAPGSLMNFVLVAAFVVAVVATLAVPEFGPLIGLVIAGAALNYIFN